MGNCNNSDKKKYSNSEASSLLESENDPTVVHKGSVLGICKSHDRIISCSDDKMLASFRWGMSPLSESLDDKVLYFSGHSKSVNRVVASNNFIWSASRDLTIRQWSPAGHCQRTYSDAHSLNVSAVAVRKDETLVFSGSRDYSVKCWDTATGKLAADFSAPRNIVTTLDIHPLREGLLFQGSEDLCVRVWDFRSRSKQPAMHLQGYVYFPLCAAIHPAGDLFATGCKGFDGVGCEVKLWDIRSPSKVICEYKEHTHDVTSCKLTSDGRYLLTASKDGSLVAWDTLTMTDTITDSAAQVAVLKATGKYFTCLEIVQESPELEFVVGSYDGSVSFYAMKHIDRDLGENGTHRRTRNSSSSREYEFSLKLQTQPHYSDNQAAAE